MFHEISKRELIIKNKRKKLDRIDFETPQTHNIRVNARKKNEQDTIER